MMLEYHMAQLLGTIKATFLDVPDRFAALLKDIDPAIANTWRLKLLEKPIGIRIANAQGASGVPLLVVTPMGSTIANDFMNDALSVDVKGFVENQRVDVLVMTSSAEEGICLEELVKAILLVSDKKLFDVYDSFSFEGMAAPSMELEALAMSKGIHVRSLQFAAVYTMQVRRIDSDPVRDLEVTGHA